MLIAKETTRCSAKAFQICTLENVVIEGIKAERIYPLKALGFLDEGDKEQEVVRALLPLCSGFPQKEGC